MGLGCASYKDLIWRGRRRRIPQDWAFSLASSDDKASQLRKSTQRKAQSATRKSQVGRQSTGDNGVRKFGVDRGVHKFDVSAKTNARPAFACRLLSICVLPQVTTRLLCDVFLKTLGYIRCARSFPSCLSVQNWRTRRLEKLLRELGLKSTRARTQNACRNLGA